MEITSLEPGNRIQLPDEWAQALGLRGQVALEKTPDGILVRACPQKKSWDEFFANPLEVGSAPHAADDSDFEVTGDDLLF